MTPFKIDILTLFPEQFPGPLGESVIGRASGRGLIELKAHDIRKFASDVRGTVDEKPYGGGPGMLMMADPVVKAVESVRQENSLVILTTPRGRVFDQKMAQRFSKCSHLVVVTGHFEGVDERAIELAIDEEVSIGDYVLSSGVPAAMVICDAVIRLLPGVLGDDESSSEESHSDGLLEYGQYTRPPVYRGMEVPEVLLSGDHGKVADYRRSEMERLTRERRPDLWKKFLSQTEKEV
ncbi:MAG: tRNA (guanosine(37)-N1)-methyltransferase TrmD [Lentisphaeria bacterium]|nr:tRNA (guanosine(37)-N1)-methyltransferase TrmD [Lentisphaeria bacterium]MBR7119829.1 tRNA (guanosine(37)-N1)-methyltransferase TrmD [Lentisphaeria bacterium]